MTTLLTRLRARPILTLVGIVALLLAAVIYVLYQTGVGSSLPVPFTASAHPDEVVNAEGGYRIEVPDGWTHTQDGRTTTVKSPDGKTVLTFGLGRTGPLPVAATLFFQQVGSKYKQVVVFPPEAKHIGGLPALVYGGVGNNDKNTRVRFLTISVQHNPTNYGIAVFTEAASDPKGVLPEVNKVVDSFRELPRK
ncbi:MAG TPA: hypothetical protein VFQ77_01550 [Pseudonocardiaceae bacterium]|jgi:hypothetical protein|nr:hypothetical protein [Pseudonocardiaceae bacterium]